MVPARRRPLAPTTAATAAAVAALALLAAPAASQATAACLDTAATTKCDREGEAYVSWPTAEWTDCRAACCTDPTCAGFTYNDAGGATRPSCFLKAVIDPVVQHVNGSRCAVLRTGLPSVSPSPLPARCGGVAYIDFQRTRAGAPFVRIEAGSYLDCQAACCGDARCRGWVFTPGSIAAGEPACALIEAPGTDYALASAISGAFLKPFPSPSPSPYASPSATFEAAFFLSTFVLCGGFLFAVWYLRRDGNSRSAGPSVLATVRAVLKRRQQLDSEAERQRLRPRVSGITVIDARTTSTATAAGAGGAGTGAAASTADGGLSGGATPVTPAIVSALGTGQAAEDARVHVGNVSGSSSGAASSGHIATGGVGRGGFGQLP